MEFDTLPKPVLEPDHVYVFFLKHLQHVSKMRYQHFELVFGSIHSCYAIIRPADAFIRIWLIGRFLLRQLPLRLFDNHTHLYSGRKCLVRIEDIV